MRALRPLLTVPVIAVLVAAGCSSGASGSEVASLADDVDIAAETEGATELTEEAALEFAQCMRDNGVEDFADPTVDADGNVTLGGGPGGAGAGGGAIDRESLATAQEACGELVEGIAFGGGGRGGFADNTELQDALVDYSACLRDEGLDVGDFDLGAGPGGGGAAEPGERAGGGQRGERAGGEGPAGLVANALDLDTEDPEVASALEECEPLLDEAFADVGAGGRGIG
ncbi:MAG: hypothetical protein OSA99_19475 [Acidimicrobiales bacterium]|nr:hypothetical protein [Acidimicrobiales bacterium]